jgi:hypothetical protein
MRSMVPLNQATVTKGGSQNFHIAAQRASGGAKELVLRLVNSDGGEQNVLLTVTGAQLAVGSPCTTSTLSGGSGSIDNIPGDPMRVSPKASSLSCVVSVGMINVTLPPNSFVNMLVPLK